MPQRQPVLTATTPIFSITFYFVHHYDHLGHINFTVDDTDYSEGYIRFGGGLPYSNTIHYRNLEFLQQMYVRPEGIIDSDGNTILIGFDGGSKSNISSFDDYVEQGYWNPLDPDHQGKVTTGKKIVGTFVSDGEVEVDEDTGIKTVRVAAHIEPAKRTPDSDTFAYPLSDWAVAQMATDSIRFRLAIPPNLEISPSELDNYSPLIAFATWLESIRTTGDAVGTNYDRDPSFENREFTLAQETGDTGVVFEFDTTVTNNIDVDDSTSDVRSYDILFDRLSGDAYNLNAIRNFLIEMKITIPTTPDIQESRFGSIGSVLEGREIMFNPGQRIYESMGHVMIDSIDEAGNPYSIPVASNIGRSIRYSDLALDIDGYRAVPLVGHVDTIHFGHAETTDGEIRLPTPTTLVSQENTHLILSFHNVSTDHELDILDWDTNLVLTLYPSDYARIQLTSDGNGGELIGQQIPLKTMSFSGDFVGDFDDTPRWDTGDARTAMLLPWSQENSQIHADAFTVGTTGVVSEERGDIDDDTIDWASLEGSWTVNMPGTMIVDWSYLLQLSSDTGVLGNYNGLRLYRVRGDSNPEEIAELVQGEFGGDNQIQLNRLNHSFQVEEGDVFFGVHRYSQRSIGLGSIEVRRFNRFVILFPHIQIPWSP